MLFHYNNGYANVPQYYIIVHSVSCSYPLPRSLDLANNLFKMPT